MFRRRSLGWPITLGVVMIVLLVALIIGWVILSVRAAQESSYWYAVLAVGATFLALMIAGVVMYLLISIKEIKLNQRQSNFIDSVTHELKSPLTSLKLYLQTLSRRQVSEQQLADFHRFMLDDLDRLDALINHMLDAARVEQAPTDDTQDVTDIELSAVLKSFDVWAAHSKMLSFKVIGDIMVDGDRAVGIVHEHAQCLANGNEYDLYVATFLTVTNKKIAEWDVFWDVSPLIRAYRNL